MNEKQIAARKHINESKKLSLDQRIDLIGKAMKEIGPCEGKLRSLRLTRWLKDSGYEPMMFSQAFRIWFSQQSEIEQV